MEDFTVKLQKLEDKMLYEFDELKNFYSVMYKNYPKNLDNLLFKVKYQVDQTKNDIFTRQEKEVIGERENKCENTDAVIKSQALLYLKELKEKVVREFYIFKYSSGSDKIYIQSIDTLLLKIMHELDNIRTDILKERNEDNFNIMEITETRKAKALLDLQKFAISITSHIINLDNHL